MATPGVPAAAIDQATRRAILESARAPAVAALGKPVLFRVEKLGVAGEWAFLRASMEAPGGGPIDFAGTPRAADAENGVVSHAYVALLRRSDAGWQVVDHAVGPTDVAWSDWARRYGAPPTIFG